MTERSAVGRDGRMQGFTLVEVMFVVVLVGVLIAISVPMYLNYRTTASDKAAQADLRTIIGVIEQCRDDDDRYPADLSPNGGSACAGQTVTMSPGSKLRYTVAKPSLKHYRLATANSRGNKYYCYNSLIGGSIQHVVGASNLPSTTC